MCWGQFSVIDPRCLNYNHVQWPGECFWCHYPLDKETWATKEECRNHAESCPMFSIFLDKE